MLGWSNIALGTGLGIYTGILLNTMVARPLWNSAILGPLFLVSGLSAGAAAMHIVSVFLPRRPAPRGMIGGAISALCQQLGSEPPERRTVDSLIRADLAFLVIELVLLGLLIINLQTSTASHIAAAALIVSGPYAWAFWGVIVALGILVPSGAAGPRTRPSDSPHRPARAARPRRRLCAALGHGQCRPGEPYRARRRSVGNGNFKITPR